VAASINDAALVYQLYLVLVATVLYHRPKESTSPQSCNRFV